MDKRSLLFTTLALALACRCAPALAGEGNQSRVVAGIHEVADGELADMRGRYIVGDNTVLWFGVQMISTWQTSNGQTLQSSLTLGLDFSKNPNQPQVSFVPTVTITTIKNAAPAAVADNINRSVQSAGLANAGGVTQSVQIAGDHNAAINVTGLNIQTGNRAPGSASSNNIVSTASTVSNVGSATSASSTGIGVNGSAATTSSPADGDATASTTPIVATNTGSSTPTGRAASVGDASASSSYDKDGAQVNVAVNGVGSASQWIRPGSLGQTIALTGDSQTVTNQMIVSMVTQSASTTTSQLARNLAQSLNMSHNR